MALLLVGQRARTAGSAPAAGVAAIALDLRVRTDSQTLPQSRSLLMKIVMLGHSNAGKTTYVSLMYELMAVGVDGFRVEARRPEDHARLAAAARAIRLGHYPDASDHRHEFQLRLRHGDSPLISFTWRDYRGGALLERSDSPQAAELQADLKAADGIVVFVDAPELASSTQARRKVRSLVFNIVQALENRRRTTPIVLAFTKWDLFKTEPPVELLLEPFRSLQQAIAEEMHIHGTAIELACGPQPMHIGVPVLWCLYFGIESQAEKLGAKVEGHVAARDAAAARNTMPNRVRAWWKGETPPLREAVEHHSRAQAEWRKLEPLIEPGQRLWSHLESLPHF